MPRVLMTLGLSCQFCPTAASVIVMTMRKNPVAIDSLEPRHMFDGLTAGVTVATAVTSSRPQKNWSINLVAGQAIIVAAGESTTSAFEPQLILITPNHKAMARSVGASGAFISKVAPITGTYVVRIRDTDGTHVSGVTVTAAFTGTGAIVDGDDAGTEQSGRRFAASISPGDLDVWSIPASGKQFLSVVANENTNGSSVGLGVAILGPDGAGVTAKESETGFAIDVPNVKSGDYYAVVYENGANASGRYGIAFGLTPGVQTTEDPTPRPLSSAAPPVPATCPAAILISSSNPSLQGNPSPSPSPATAAP